ARAELEGFQHLVVTGVGEIDAFLVAIEGVLGTDRGVIETGADRVRELDLAVVVLKDVGLRALENAELAAFETRGVFAAFDAAAAGFDADQAYGGLLEKFEEEADRVRTAADAGDH